MEKAKVTMRNWEPYVYDGEYNLSGLRMYIHGWEEMSM